MLLFLHRIRCCLFLVKVVFTKNVFHEQGACLCVRRRGFVPAVQSAQNHSNCHNLCQDISPYRLLEFKLFFC